MRYFNAVLSLTRIRTWREAALTLGAILGVLCIAATIASVAFEVKPLVFRSGSMSPTITTGALAFAKSQPATDLKVGDIVSVKDSNGIRVTHRIQKVQHDGSKALLTLKGDANDVADARPYPVQSADRVMFSVPKAGYVVAWFSGPVGVFLGGLLVGGLLIIAFRPNSDRKHDGKRRAMSSGMVLVVGLAGFGGLNLVRASPTMALWNDTATVNSKEFKAYTVPKPTLMCSDNAILGFLLATEVTMTWTAPTAPYTNNFTAKILGSNQTLAVISDGTKRKTVIKKKGLITLSLGRTATVEVIASLPGTNPLWVGQPATKTFQTGLLGLTFGC